MSAGEAPSPPRSLSRVQVYLYAVLALFSGTVLVGLADPLAGGLPRGQSLLVYAAAGLGFGLVAAFVAVYAVVRRIRSLQPEARYRLDRLHTVALTGVVLGFPLLVSVEPSLVGGASDPAGLLPLPSNLVSVLPLVAAAVTLAALGAYRYRRGRKRERGRGRGRPTGSER